MNNNATSTITPNRRGIHLWCLKAHRVCAELQVQICASCGQPRVLLGCRRALTGVVVALICRRDIAAIACARANDHYMKCLSARYTGPHVFASKASKQSCKVIQPSNAPSRSWLDPLVEAAALARLRVARLERKGRRELTGSVAAVAALRGEERPLEGEVLGETAAPLVWDGCEWALLLEALLRLRLDLRRSSPRSCTGYGLAARFFGLGGGTTPAWPDFSSFRKNFCAWLRTCHHRARHQHHMTCRPTDALTAEPTVLSRMIEASKRRSMNAVAKTHEIIVLRQKGRQLPGRCQSPSKPRTTVRNGREKPTMPA